MHVNEIRIGKEDVSFELEGSSKSIAKKDILCVWPEGKNGYTFLVKNQKKQKILKRDMENNHEAPDRARIFAYKLFGTSYDLDEVYKSGGNESISKEDFVSAFEKHTKKIKRRNATGIGLAVGALIIGAAALISTMEDVQAVSSLEIDYHIPLNEFSPPSHKLLFDSSQITAQSMNT